MAAERATLEEVRAQLGKAETDIVNYQQAQENARRHFTEELEKLKSAAQLDKDRYTAAERRFLQETDRERQVSARIQKELDQARQESRRLQERHRSEIDDCHEKLGQLKHELGVLEGRLQTVVEERNQLSMEVRDCRIVNSELQARQAQRQGEVKAWQTKAEKAEKFARESKRATTTKRIRGLGPSTK